MISIECHSIIPHPREDVFRTGINRDTLPTDIEGFSLKVLAEEFGPGVGVRVEVNGVEHLPSLKLKGEVKEFVPNELVLVRAGAFATVSADVKLELSDYKYSQTLVDYGIYVTPKNPVTKMAEPHVEPLLHERVRLFSDGYTANVTKILDALLGDPAPRRTRKKAA